MAPRQIQAVGWKRTGRQASSTRKAAMAARGWAASQSNALGLRRIRFGLDLAGLLQEGGDKVLLLHLPDELALAVDEALAGAAGHAEIGVLGFARPVHHAAHDGVGDVLVVDGLQALLDLVRHAIQVDLHPAAAGAAHHAEAAGAQGQGPQHFVAHAALVLAVAGQRDADGVAQALGQQDAHPDAGADGAAEGRTGLRDAQVEGVVHLLGQQAVGLHGADHVAGLEADLDVPETLALQDVNVAQGALHHGFGGGRAELLEQILLQAAAVDADADRNSLGSGLAHHGLHAVLAADVAGVDAQAGGAAIRGHQGQAIVEVDVGHHGDGAAVADLVEDLAGLLGGDAHADDLAAGVGVAIDLVDGGFHIPGVRLGHALDADGGIPAHGNLAHQDLAGLPAGGEGLEFLIGHGASDFKDSSVPTYETARGTPVFRGRESMPEDSRQEWVARGLGSLATLAAHPRSP